MTAFDTDAAITLTEQESWALLASVALGRLVTVLDGQPEIFPVNFAVQRNTIVVRTAEGTKLMSTAINPLVAFEADDHDVEAGWSVVVKGLAQVVNGAADLADAERAQVLPWTSTPKSRFIRIVPNQISGRRFVFGSESDQTSGLG